ncbi:MAG: 50S ribosomal protein L11 methyltransferase [Gammaproteobacteria bacterium]
MPWTQITFYVNSEQALQLSELLTDAGSVAVTLQDAVSDGIEQPLYEPPLGETPLWQTTRVQGLFEADINADALIAELTATLEEKFIAGVQVEHVADKDWERECLDNFRPMHFGARLWICPTWHTPPDTDAINLLLDPGLAFGTGTHATTALCLEWLATAQLQDLDVIDYGCGSGILAIAAAKLGARSVWAVDNDPQALQATGVNAEKNGLRQQRLAVGDRLPQACALREIIISLPNAGISAQADLLLANILAGPLIDLAPYFATLVRTGGRIILSGILSGQAAGVTEAYAANFMMAEPVARDGWVRLEGRRKSAKV